LGLAVASHFTDLAGRGSGASIYAFNKRKEWIVVPNRMASKKEEIGKFCYRWQILKPSGKERQRGASQFISKHQKGQRRKLL
jgi:hypothetical protein